MRDISVPWFYPCFVPWSSFLRKLAPFLSASQNFMFKYFLSTLEVVGVSSTNIWKFPEIGLPLNHLYWNGIFYCKPSILGIPHLWKPPYFFEMWFPWSNQPHQEEPAKADKDRAALRKHGATKYQEHWNEKLHYHSYITIFEDCGNMIPDFQSSTLWGIYLEYL